MDLNLRKKKNSTIAYIATAVHTQFKSLKYKCKQIYITPDISEVQKLI